MRPKSFSKKPLIKAFLQGFETFGEFGPWKNFFRECICYLYYYQGTVFVWISTMVTISSSLWVIVYESKTITINKNHKVFWYLTFAVDQVWIWEVDRSIWEVFWQEEFQEVQSFIIGISTTIHILARRDSFLIVLVASNPESLQEFLIACYSIEVYNKMSVFPNEFNCWNK